MAKTTFSDALRTQLTTRNDLWSKRILVLLDRGDSRLKRWFLGRAERSARLALNVSDKAAIDWSQIDWAKVLDFILKLAALILPLLLAKPKIARPKSAPKPKKALGRTQTRKRL